MQPGYYTWMVMRGEGYTCCCCSRLLRCQCYPDISWVATLCSYGADRVGVSTIDEGKKTGSICGIWVRGVFALWKRK